MADEPPIIIPVDLDTTPAEAKAKTLAQNVADINRRSSGSVTPEEFAQRTERTRQQYPSGAIETGINQAGDRDSKQAPNLEAITLGETNREIGASAEAIRLFRETLHTIHPALQEAGIGFGEFTSLAYAGRGGIVALGAAIGGLLVTALEKAGDAAADASTRLGAFTGSVESGKGAFENVQGVARQLNVSPTGLAAPFEQLLRINQQQPPGQQQSQGQLNETLTNLVRGLQAERVPGDKAVEKVTALLEDVRKNGFLSGDALAKFAEGGGQRTAAALVEQLQKNQPGRAIFGAGAVTTAAAQIAPDVQKNVEESAVFSDSIATAWDKMKASSERLAQASSGGHLIARAIEGAGDTFDLIAQAIEKAKRARIETFAESGPRILNAGADQGNLDEAFKSFTGGANAGSLTGSQEQLRKSGEEAAAALDKLRDPVERYIQQQQELNIVSADAAKKQAALNLKFEPAETESKLAKDQIAVQNADIHLESAKISGLEAQKGIEEARLAPESAREAVHSAQGTYDAALSKFFKSQGIDTTFLDQQNAIAQQGHELDAASTALKRAKIEQKYSYLEEPKAQLAAEQSETAIRSAEIEKSDTRLKLAKDTEGRPISHELAQLNYAQASLDQDKTRNELLTGILEKIGEKGNKEVGTYTGEGSAPPKATLSTTEGFGPGAGEVGTIRRRVEGFGPGAGEFLPGQSGPRDITPREILPRTITPRDITPLEQRSEGEGDLGAKSSEAAASVSQLGEAAASVVAQLAALGTGQQSAPQRAALGGLIRGPGTGTSDSINARLSDREYVVNADAVQHWGEGFMHAINQKRLPGFALGGMLPRGSGSLAGAVGYGTGVRGSAGEMEHWGTIDMRTDHGDFRAATERDTMQHLSSSAKRAKRYSTGNKPSWYGGTA